MIEREEEKVTRMKSREFYAENSRFSARCGREKGGGEGGERAKERRCRWWGTEWMLNIDRVARLQKQPPPL